MDVFLKKTSIVKVVFCRLIDSNRHKLAGYKPLKLDYGQNERNNR